VGRPSVRSGARAAAEGPSGLRGSCEGGRSGRRARGPQGRREGARVGCAPSPAPLRGWTIAGTAWVAPPPLLFPVLNGESFCGEGYEILARLRMEPGLGNLPGAGPRERASWKIPPGAVSPVGNSVNLAWMSPVLGGTDSQGFL